MCDDALTKSTCFSATTTGGDAGGTLADPSERPLAERLFDAHWKTPEGIEERAGYLPQAGEQLYYVLHLPAGRPLGNVLLTGPFAADRWHMYVSWVRWGRFLARRGFAAMRFDYRGLGESSGRFEDQDFSAWLDDLLLCARFLKRNDTVCPLILCGVRLGGLLSSCAFAQGVGDALLLWSPPGSGRDMLIETLRRRVAADMTSGSSTTRTTREQYIAELTSGGTVEVEGYCWSKRLWDDSARYVLQHGPGEASPPGSTPRPWRGFRLNPQLGPLAGNLTSVLDPVNQVRVSPLNPDVDGFFADNVEWIRSVLPDLGSAGSVT